MQTPEHEKHARVARPALGQFARQEWAVMGAPCDQIHGLISALCSRLGARHKIACLDADHHSSENAGWLEEGAGLVYTNKIRFHRIDRKAEPNPFEYKALFNEMDAVLVNGNHFAASRQILILDPRKFDSLSRKTDRLSQVELVLELPEKHPAPDFLRAHLGDQLDRIPRLPVSDHEGIAAWLSGRLQAGIPQVRALILAGGRSTRMGKDKSLMDYHGRPQREYLYDMMEGMGLEPFISLAPGQTIEDRRYLNDTFLGLGPMSAILSAFREQPDTAWLALACDLPLVDGQVLKTLLENRRPTAVATAFRSPESGFPEPLAAIWEPRSYARLLGFLAQGYSCPRKVLINSDTHIIDPPSPESMLNANRPEEAEQILKQYVGR